MSALARDGSVPAFSDRDAVYNDIAAPGEDILSTLPRALTRENADVPRPGLLRLRAGGLPQRGGDVVRGAAGHRRGRAPARAAPGLTADQVAALIERSADDVNAVERLRELPAASRFALRLGQAQHRAALSPSRHAGAPPAADRFETNDDAGAARARASAARAGRSRRRVDYWDDQTRRLRDRPRGGPAADRVARRAAGTAVQLLLWSPRTRTVFGAREPRLAVARSVRPARASASSTRVPRAKGGWYYVEARIVQPGAGATR